MPDHEAQKAADPRAAAIAGKAVKTDDPATIPDEKLMARFAKGDAGAFEELYRRHRGPVFRFILRSSNGDRAGAEDLLQDVMMKVMGAADRYEPKAKFTTWLFRIARNTCIDAARKRKHEPQRRLSDSIDNDDDGMTLEDKLGDETMSPEDEAVNMETRIAITELMESMNPEQREVFLLRETEGLPFKEVAEIIGTTESTAKSRMRYALTYLAKGLGERGMRPGG